MGRWRDACVMVRTESDAIDSAKLEELVIDQQSELVGVDKKGQYRVIKHEEETPRLVKFEIHYDQLSSLKREDDGRWRDPKTQHLVYDFIETTPEIYSAFRAAVAEVFSRFPFGRNFLSYLRGPADTVEEPNSLKLTLAVSPIHVTEKDHLYEPIGVSFPGDKFNKR